MSRLLAPVSGGILATISAIGAVAAIDASPAGPPGDPPPESSPPESTVDPGAAAFERQLAELSFGTFLAIDLDVTPDVFSCTEPLGPDEMVTCFALVDDGRAIVGRSPTSGSTGRFTFDVVADYEIGGPADGSEPPSVPDATEAPGDGTVAVTYSDADRNAANVAILVYGDNLDRSASTEIGAIVAAANGSVLSISRWQWDASTATFSIDYTVNGDAGLSSNESAWLTASAMSAHWEAGQPFREPAASIRPSLNLQVSGSRYTSSWDLMTRIADGDISDADWLAAATAG